MSHPILDLPMQENDADEYTIRGYLKALLRGLIERGESFSGKRPFGNSGWDYDLFIPLIKAGIVKGSLDEDGFVEELDKDAAQEKILAAINDL